MGRFSVDRSMNVGGQPPSPTMPQTQPYGQQNYGSPYGQQMPQQQGMMMQQQQQNWPTFFPKETIGIDRGAILNDTKPILTASDIEITANEIIKIRHKLNEILAEKTGQKVDKIANDSDRDYWMDASHAMDYGIVDKVVEKTK